MKVTKQWPCLPAQVFLFETEAWIVLDLGSIDWALHTIWSHFGPLEIVPAEVVEALLKACKSETEELSNKHAEDYGSRSYKSRPTKS
ncbi:hypothetical protein P8452_11885 [Trifolium repens]|nr:hypothetical protein P8452_11885 [Trifolium repens]